MKPLPDAFVQVWIIFDELLARLTLASHGFEYVVPGAHEDGIGNS